MKRMLCALLLVSIMATVIAGCTQEGNTDAETTVVSGSESEAATTATAAERAVNLYGDLDYDGATFTFATITPGTDFHYDDTSEVYYDTDNGDYIVSAIYTRNLKTDELLNVDIQAAYLGGAENIKKKIAQNVLANDYEYDAVLNYLSSFTEAMASGYYLNLLNIDTVDVNDECWDKNIISTYTLNNNRLYTISGSLNYFDDLSIVMLMVNTDILKDIYGSDLYQTVRDGDWTYDKFIQIAALATKDVDGNSEIDYHDQVGVVGDTALLSKFVFCMGYTITETDTDGSNILRDVSDDLVSAVNKITTPIFSTNTFIVDNTYNWYNDTLMNGRVLFYPLLGTTLRNFRALDNDYDVIPMPKYDENINSYYAYADHNMITTISIPITVADSEYAGAVLSVMSLYSHDTLIPAVLEKSLEQKWVRDDESVEMLQTYIFPNKIYQIASQNYLCKKHVQYLSRNPDVQGCYIFSFQI